MEVTIWITREGFDYSNDIEITVDCDVDQFGSLSALHGYDKDGNSYTLTDKERARAADQAWEEYHDDL